MLQFGLSTLGIRRRVRRDGAGMGETVIGLDEFKRNISEFIARAHHHVVIVVDKREPAWALIPSMLFESSFAAANGLPIKKCGESDEEFREILGSHFPEWDPALWAGSTPAFSTTEAEFRKTPTPILERAAIEPVTIVAAASGYPTVLLAHALYAERAAFETRKSYRLSELPDASQWFDAIKAADLSHLERAPSRADLLRK